MTVHLVGAGPGRPRPDHGPRPRARPLLRRARPRPARRSRARRRGARRARSSSAGTGSTRRRSTELLVDSGQLGLDVVRLKGGDPFVFGRGGEEALALPRPASPSRSCPGVSSIAAVPAAAGNPDHAPRHLRPRHDRELPRRRRRRRRLRAAGRDRRHARPLHGARTRRAGRRRPARGRNATGDACRRDLPRHAAGPGGRADDAARSCAAAAAGLAGPALIVLGDVARWPSSGLQGERLRGAEVAEPESAARHRALAAEPA